MRALCVAAMVLLLSPAIIPAQDDEETIRVINLTEDLPGMNIQPRLAVDARKGNVIVVWENNSNIYASGLVWKKKGRYIAKDQRLVSPPSGTHRRPDIAWMNSSKRFVAVWDNWPDELTRAKPAVSIQHGNRRAGPAATASDIFGRVLRKTARPKGDVITFVSDGAVNTSPVANTVRSNIPDWSDRSFSLSWYKKQQLPEDGAEFPMPVLYRQYFDRKIREVTDAEIRDDYFAKFDQDLNVEIITSDTIMREAGELDGSLDGFLYSDEIYGTAYSTPEGAADRTPFWIVGDRGFIIGSEPPEFNSVTVMGASRVQRFALGFCQVNLNNGAQGDDCMFGAAYFSLDALPSSGIDVKDDESEALEGHIAPLAHVNLLPPEVGGAAPALADMPDYELYDMIFANRFSSIYHVAFDGDGNAKSATFLLNSFDGKLYDGRAEIVPTNGKIVAVFEMESPKDAEQHDIYVIILDKPNPEVIADPAN